MYATLELVARRHCQPEVHAKSLPLIAVGYIRTRIAVPPPLKHQPRDLDTAASESVSLALPYTSGIRKSQANRSGCPHPLPLFRKSTLYFLFTLHWYSDLAVWRNNTRPVNRSPNTLYTAFRMLGEVFLDFFDGWQPSKKSRSTSHNIPNVGYLERDVDTKKWFNRKIAAHRGAQCTASDANNALHTVMTNGGAHEDADTCLRGTADAPIVAYEMEMLMEVFSMPVRDMKVPESLAPLNITLSALQT